PRYSWARTAHRGPEGKHYGRRRAIHFGRTRELGMRDFPVLAGLFVPTLMISQVTATKPVHMGVVFTGADLIFPLSYVLGDVLTEVYGFGRSRIVIWTGLAANVFMSAALWFVGILPGEAGWVA